MSSKEPLYAYAALDGKTFKIVATHWSRGGARDEAILKGVRSPIVTMTKFVKEATQ